MSNGESSGAPESGHAGSSSQNCQKQPYSFMIKHIALGFLLLKNKRALANKSPHGDTVCEELNLTCISKDSVNFD